MMNWSQLTTQGRIDAIRSVWQPGMSAAQIASHFDGVSRNAVIGIFHRHKPDGMYLGVKGENGQAKSVSVKATRKRGGIRGGTVSRNRLRVVTPAPAIEHASFGAPHVAGIPLAMFNGHRCKWCVNDPEKGETHLFCGEVANEGQPYCAYHATRAVGQGTESERSADRAARHLSAA